jgi:hypothetical protein
VRKREEADWDDGNDIAIIDWKRIRESLEHENLLKNQRVTWLLSSQGFLFASYVLTFTATTKKDFDPVFAPILEVLLASIAATGIVIAFLLFLGVRAAEVQHKALQLWWENRYKFEAMDHPPICGSKPRLGFTIHQFFLPLVFIPTWLILSIAAFKQYFLENFQFLGTMLQIATAVMGALAIGFIVGRQRTTAQK